MRENLVKAKPATERTEIIARYEEMRYGMFLHYTINTFLDEPFWDTMKGPLPPTETYSPTKLDVDQSHGNMRYFRSGKRQQRMVLGT